MKRLATKWFMKWSKKVNLSNQDMLNAIVNLEKGLSTSELGGNLYKIRVSRFNKGKRSGFRTIVVYKKEYRAIFLYGFGKNEKENISESELRYFKKLGGDLLSIDTVQLKHVIEHGTLYDLEAKK